MSRLSNIIIGTSALFLILLALGCDNDGTEDFAPPLPFPDSDESEFIQARMDSSEFLWYTDIKAAASSFVNEFGYDPDGISTTAIRILGEGLFHGTVEVELPDRILTLTMERPFKHKGKESLWQVTRVEERPWRKQDSR